MNLRKFLSVIFILFVSASTVFAADIYDSAPSFSPYYAGKVKAETLNEALEELNYIRWLVGVPNNVVLNSEYTNKAQHGAVLLDAINTLTHTPSKPSDMSEEFYSLGYDSTTHGNLFVSQLISNGNIYGNVSLSSSLKGYMDDSDSHNISAVGHRRWLMNPRLKQTGFGISTRKGYSVTYVIEEFGEVNTQEDYQRYLQWLEWPISDEFITWPTSKHNHPLTYFNSQTAWSVTLDRNIFDECDINSVNVTLTCLNDNETWIFNKTSSNGDFYISENNVAYDECIIFRPNDISNYENGEVWRVNISGLKRKDGGSGNISYTVTFTDASTDYDDDYVYDYRNTLGGEGSSGVSCNAGNGIFSLILISGIPHVKKFLRVRI